MGNYWNYWVPTINSSIASIDIVQVMAYNNWYDGLSQGSLDYLKDTTLQWLNMDASMYCSGCSVIPNFSGVPLSKLSIGFLASKDAGGPSSYTLPTVLNSYQNWLVQSNMSPASLFIWDSHWDSLNSYLISNAIT